MLSQEDNDILCRVGSGTPMGNLMREYWIPALPASEFPSPDSPPKRMRLLGENLVMFRDTRGDVGCFAEACPHRGASLFFGRNEEEGLRCVYHGWKFDVTGQCVDMPSEPAESNFKTKIKARAYPCVERNGVIWAYMGPREVPPSLPDLLPNLEPDCWVQRRMEECNFMQALEGDIDTVHFGFLHVGHVVPDRDLMHGSADYYAVKTRDAKFYTNDHEIGSTYAAVRPAEADSDYWRTGHFLMPYITMNAPGVMPLKNSCNAWVPLDDENTMVWSIGPRSQQRMDPNLAGIGGLKIGVRVTADPQGKYDPYQRNLAGVRQVQQRMFEPEKSDWLGHFRPLANKDNDYLIDRDLQKRIEW